MARTEQLKLSPFEKEADKLKNQNNGTTKDVARHSLAQVWSLLPSGFFTQFLFQTGFRCVLVIYHIIQSKFLDYKPLVVKYSKW